MHAFVNNGVNDVIVAILIAENVFLVSLIIFNSLYPQGEEVVKSDEILDTENSDS